jgi:peptide/nickel transport system substrate-binding protein
MLGAPIGSIVDPAVFAQVGKDALNGGQAPGAGAGAYEVESWDRAVSVVLKRKADYWGPKPCVEKFEELFFSDTRTRNDAFTNGEVDALYARGPLPNKLVKDANMKDIESYSQVVNGGSVFVINENAGGTERPGMDVRVRQAIAYALDPSVVDDRVNQGAGRPSKSFVDKDSAWFSDGVKEIPVDPKKAKELLDEAKADGYDGHLDYKSGNTPDAVDTALIYEAQLEAVGFTVDVDSTRDSAGISQMLLQSHDFDVTTSALSAFDSDILGELNKRVSPWTGYTSPEWTAALDKLGTASTVDAKKAAVAEVSKVWNEQVPWVTLDHHEVGVYWNAKYTGVGFSKAGFVLIDGIKPA